MPEFITDRSSYHVCLLKSLRGKNYADMSNTDKQRWDTEAAKGAYNYTDLNRVESAVAAIAAELGLSLTTKTNWKMTDVPYAADMSRYLNNIRQIVSVHPVEDEITQDIPTSMNELTWRGANAIEKALETIYVNLNNYFVVYDLTGVTLSNKPSYIAKNASFVTQITPNSGYEISSVTVTMGGTDVTQYWNQSTGVLSISQVTATLYITVTAFSTSSGGTGSSSVLGTGKLGEMTLGNG